MLVDSHCHLDHEAFGGDVEGVLRRARQANVLTTLTISTSVKSFPRVLEIAERNEGVFCTVGVHPHEAAAERDVTVEHLIELARHPKVVGIGECGLDYYYNHSAPDTQVAVFKAHVAAARASGLPLVVHTRDADSDMGSILEAEHQAGPIKGVLHCFSSGRALAETAVRLGFFISFSGILTFKNSDELRQIAAALPADQLLIETDAPYLAPVPMRGRRNEPSFVGYTLDALVRCRGQDKRELAEATTANFFELFAKATQPNAS